MKTARTIRASLELGIGQAAEAALSRLKIVITHHGKICRRIARNELRAPGSHGALGFLEMTPSDILKAVVATMKAERYCFLITSGELGWPSARMVEATVIDDDLTVWMITRPDSRKVREIEHDERTTMAFSDNNGEGYAVLTGTAKLVRDLSRKKSMWKMNYEAFFPAGPEGNDSILVQFRPSRIEIMHFHLKIGIWPWTMKPAVLERNGDVWRLDS